MERLQRMCVCVLDCCPDNSALSVVLSHGDKACDKSTAIVAGHTDCVCERKRAAIFIADKKECKRN